MVVCVASPENREGSGRSRSQKKTYTPSSKPQRFLARCPAMMALVCWLSFCLGSLELVLSLMLHLAIGGAVSIQVERTVSLFEWSL